jgi:hypothetical protein
MKNSIKKSKWLILLSLIVLGSCSDDLIEIENQNKPDQSKFYVTALDFNVGLQGCYNTLRPPVAFEWMLTEIRSDNTFMNNYGSTNPQNLQIYSNDIFEAPSFDLFIESYWATTYQSIRSINALADGLKTSYDASTGTIVYNTADLPIATDVRKRYSGEASFMRANHYFNLVRLYGGVFLIDKIITPDEALKLNRVTVADIYKFVIADLKNAVANCTTTKFSASGTVDKGVASVWAAKALLAKVYLTLGDKASAQPLLADVIANSGHALITAGTTPYNDVFSSTNELNSEMIFAVRFKSGGLGYGSSLCNLFANPNSSVSGMVTPTGTRGGFNNPTAELYDSYQVVSTTVFDKRRDFNIKILKPSGTSSPAQPLKWTYWSGKHNIAVSVANDSELDWPVIRYSDVLLMYCEAFGNTPTSLTYLNQVHVRAGLPALTAFASTALFEAAVAKERRWEFAMENQRWYDLLRFEKTMPSVVAKDVMNNHFALMSGYYNQYNDPFTTAQLQAKTNNPKFDLLPIPNVEIVTNTEIAIPNNPGY